MTANRDRKAPDASKELGAEAVGKQASPEGSISHPRVPSQPRGPGAYLPAGLASALGASLASP